MTRYGFTKKFLAFALALVALPGCSCSNSGGNGRPGDQLTIGVVAPFEGPSAHIGDAILRSVQLRFENELSPDLRVRVVPIDTKSNPPDAVAALQASASDESLVGLVGFYHSSTALACKPIVQEAKLPTLIYSASNPAVTDEAPYYFRLVPTDDSQAVVLANYAKELGAKDVAILYYADEYGKGLSDGIQERAQSIGIHIVSTQSYDDTTTDFRPVLTVLKDKSPDVVIICGFVEKSIAILNQAAERQLRATFLAGDGTFNEQQLVQGAGENAEGVYVAAPYVFDDASEKDRAFLASYLGAGAQEQGMRKPASWTAFAYDAAGILSDALKAGKRNRKEIYEYIRAIDSEDSAYQGITGATYFDANGDAVGRRFRLAVVRDGKFEAVK